MLILIDARDECVTTKAATPWERLVSHVRSYALDREIAAGASPEHSATVALRAQALVRPSMRRALARRVEQLLDDAAQQSVPSREVLRVPISSDGILQNSDALRILIERILAPVPLSARGVAGVRVLLTDGAGPLYYPGHKEDLRARLLQIVEQLEPLNRW